MRPPIISRALGACALMAGVALAQNAGNPGDSTLRVPVGQPFRQFTFPVYGTDGQLHYSFYAVEATGVTINRAETTDLRIDVYDNGEKTTVITSPKADLYVAEQTMRTKNTVHVERQDMDATSQDCDFDVKQKKFFMRTHVKVLLKHFDVGGGTPKPGSSTASGPATYLAPSRGASAVPRPASMPSDDSILPNSPGAYSDTNAAPIPPPPGSTSQ